MLQGGPAATGSPPVHRHEPTAEHCLFPWASHWGERGMQTEHPVSKSPQLIQRHPRQSNVPAATVFWFCKGIPVDEGCSLKSNEHLSYGKLSTWVFLSPEPNDLLQWVPQRGV